MTTPEEYVRDTTGGGTWGNLSQQSRADFVSYQWNLVNNATIIVESEAQLPGDAHIRANGVFNDAEDLLDYLERGGLVIPTPGGEFGEYAPVGFVYVIATLLPDDTYQYQVYIRDDSE